MGLPNGCDFVDFFELCVGLGGFEGSDDFSGVVGIVVNNAKPVFLDNVKAFFDACEVF